MVTERRKQRFVKNMERWGAIFNAVLNSTKPIISAIALLVYNITLTVMLFMGKLETSDYMAAVGPLSMAAIGFWFARRKETPDADGNHETQQVEEQK